MPYVRSSRNRQDTDSQSFGFEYLGKVPEGANSYIDGKFVTKPPTYNELALPILQQRELQLSSSDWTQNNDSPLSLEKKQDWSIFRQQWRDITSQINYPYEVNYPVKPI